MSKSRCPIFSPEMITPKPLSPGMGETVTLLKVIPLSLAHVGRNSIEDFAERIIVTVMVNFFKLEYR